MPVLQVQSNTPGSVTIAKDSVPNDAQDFQFYFGTSPGTGGFMLDDDDGASGADGTYSNIKTFTGLTAGTYYYVNEGSLPAGWQSCRYRNRIWHNFSC